MPSKQKAIATQPVRTTLYLQARIYQLLSEMAQADHDRSVSAYVSILVEAEENRQRLAQKGGQEAQNVG